MVMWGGRGTNFRGLFVTKERLLETCPILNNAYEDKPLAHVLVGERVPHQQPRSAFSRFPHVRGAPCQNGRDQSWVMCVHTRKT